MAAVLVYFKAMRRLCLFFVIVILSALACAENLKLPKTPAGRRFSALLSAFNSRDAQQVRGFILDNYAGDALQQRSADDRAATYFALYEETGGLQPRQVEHSADNTITVLTEARTTHEWYRITCQAQPRKPYRLLGVIFRLIPPPPEFAAKGKLSDEQIVADIDEYAEKLSEARLFGGVVLLARGTKPLLEKAYPWRAAGHTQTYSVDDRFGLASINKVFTAVVIGQLADAGKLSVTDTIAHYLPQFPHDRGEKITIHELLTHTAGIEPMLDPKAFEEMRQANLKTRADQVQFLGARPPVAAAGEKFVYSNAGYMLLEGIVESIVHEPFQNYLRAHVFEPLGMNRTGGGDSTAADMLRFSVGLTGGKLLSAKTLATMMAEQVKTDDPEVGYGYGLEVQTVNGTRVVGHGGGGPGISAQLDIYPDQGYTVVVLSRRQYRAACRQPPAPVDYTALTSCFAPSASAVF